MQIGATGEDAVRLLEPGDMFGDYTVERLLGKGGMGAVYLVRSPGGMRYAIKVMFPEMVRKGSGYRKRFAREAEFAMKIRHKNLISVYDVGEDPETGLCYIIMDYVQGGSVADRLEKCGRFGITEAVSIAAQVALALEVAHGHGVVHRDIKPENIMFDADGTPKLADLGVAKFSDGTHKTTMTTTGMIIGTPAYMAPEQMMDSHHIDARADIYALGVVLYEMLTGTRPNEGSTAVELLTKAIKGEALPDVRTQRPEVPAAIAHALSLLCAPRPAGRPPTGRAAAELLDKAISGTLALPKKFPRAVDELARRKKRKVYVAAAVAAAGVASVALCVVLAAVFLKKKPVQEQVEPPDAPVPALTTNAVPQAAEVTVTDVVDRAVSAAEPPAPVAEPPAPAAEPPAPAAEPPAPAAEPPAPAAEPPAPVAEAGDAEGESNDVASSPEEFSFKPPTPKFQMSVHEDSLGWLDQGERPDGEPAVRVCHDLSHGGYPGTNRLFFADFLADGNRILFKPCWHDLARENLQSVNVLVLPSSSAQILYGEAERAAIDKFLARGGTVIAFVDANENNIWSMNEFLAPYGLEVFVMDEYPSMDSGERLENQPAKPTCSALKDMRPELKLDTFAAPTSESGREEWSSVLTAGRKARTVVAARRVGSGRIIYASAGLQWYLYGGIKHGRAVTGWENKKFWSTIFKSAARGCPIPDDVPMGERPVTDAPVMLTAGPITIYAAERWRDNAGKLRDIVRQAVPLIERYCGRALDPANMEQTKFVLTSTGIQGYVNVGAKTLVTSARFRGYPDKIGYFSEFVFSRMMQGVAEKGKSVALSWYIANLVLGDMGFPGEMELRIDEGLRRDADFSKYRLALDGKVLDGEGHEERDSATEIGRAKIFSALEEIRKRHPDVVVDYFKHVKDIYGEITRPQSAGILSEITGEDCFKIFERYGIDCPRELSAIDPTRIRKPSLEAPGKEPAEGARNDVLKKADAQKENDVKKGGNARKDAQDAFEQEYPFIKIMAGRTEKRHVEELKQIVSDVIQKLDKRMGGAFIPEMRKSKTIIVFGNKKGSSRRLRDGTEIISISATDFAKQGGKRWTIISLVENLLSLSLYGTLYYARPRGNMVREEPILQILRGDVLRSIPHTAREFSQTHAYDVSQCLQIDPGMNRYDFDGMPWGKPRAKRLNASRMEMMAKAKVVWSFQELSEKYEQLSPLYWKARLKMKEDLANPVSLDDMVVLLSIAANENLLDWFSAHGLNKKHLNTNLKMPNLQPAK